MPMTDEELREQLHRVINESYTWDEVAQKTGRPYSTIRRHAKSLGIMSPDGFFAKKQALADKASSIRYQRENEVLKRTVADLTSEKERVEMLAGINLDTQRRASPPQWTVDAPKHKSEVIASALYSDWHYGETVNPGEVEYMNCFNNKIADARIRTTYVNTVKLGRHYLSGVTIKGIVTPYCGDMFSGNIHEELIETNEGAITDCFVSMYEQIIAGTELLYQQFGKVYAPWVVGNHPRLFPKFKMKGYARNNFDYMLGRMLQVHYKRQTKRDITFDISDAVDLPYRVYNNNYLLTHGNQFRGGSGIAGLLSPLMIGDHRKRKRNNSVNKPYDWLVMGHWHTRATFMGIIVNGSLKGYDEYAYGNNFGYQDPAQSFWVDDPVHGITITAPIFVKADDEKWGEEEQKVAVMQ
jgi:hypothetical protein